MIPISKPHLYKEDKQYAIKAIRDEYIGQGEYIKQFEEEFSNYCGRSYGVTCSNGTSALYLAIKALDLPKGSEVIIPSMTIVSCLTAVLENDLKPIFCDVDIITWNIDFKSVYNKINNNTSAIIVVDTYGLMVTVDDILLIKSQYPNIKIIEDASEAHGASYWDYKAGSLGDISTFSFYSNKIITTGEGGMILTDDIKTYERLLSLRNLNFTERSKYIHSEPGWNFRLNNVSCGIGLGQLHNINRTINQRVRIANRYNRNLSKCSSIQLPFESFSYVNVYWYYSIVIKKNYNKVLEALKDNNIDYRHFFYPLHKQPFINSEESLPISEYLFDNGLILPTFTKLKNSEINFISKVIIKAIE
jgi:perosamine synthetase